MRKLFENFWFCLFFGLALLQFATDAGRSLLKRADQEPKIQALQQEIENLKANQNLMVWQMDKSCFDQLKNNFDHALYLKLSPEK